MTNITACIASRPRTVRPASYGARYDSIYKHYEFTSESEAIRFLIACGYRIVSGKRIRRTSSSCVAHVGVSGMSYAFRGPRGDAVLAVVEID